MTDMIWCGKVRNYVVKLSITIIVKLIWLRYFVILFCNSVMIHYKIILWNSFITLAFESVISILNIVDEIIIDNRPLNFLQLYSAVITAISIIYGCTHPDRMSQLTCSHMSPYQTIFWVHANLSNSGWTNVRQGNLFCIGSRSLFQCVITPEA